MHTALELLLVAVTAVSVGAQTRDTAVKVVVTLDRSDWRYHVGDSARFHVEVRRAGVPVPDARVIVQLGHERLPPLRTDTMRLTSQGLTVKATLAAPGFLRLTATSVVNGATAAGMATAGFDPQRIHDWAQMPADFEQFWRDAIDSARKVPLAPVMTRLPERSTPEVDVYHVSFQNHRAGSRIYGMLSMPSKPGKYPAILSVPGAGVRPYFPNVATARKGVIYLSIGIHGIPVDRDSLLYNELRATALAKYWTYNLDDRDAYYYKRVFVGVVKAGDFLLGLPQADTARYAVEGGSQGGGLAIVAGVLDPRVKAIAVTHPALGDHFALLHGQPSGWPFFLADTIGMPAKKEKMATLPYYDVVNFARLLKIPGIYAWGFNDNTVPPTSAFAIYNAIPTSKELIIVPEMGHTRAPVQAERMDAWLLERLRVTGGR